MTMRRNAKPPCGRAVGRMEFFNFPLLFSAIPQFQRLYKASMSNPCLVLMSL